MLHKLPRGGGEHPARQARQPDGALGGRLQLQDLTPCAGGTLLEHQLGHQGKALPAGYHGDHALVVHDVAAARHMQVILFEIALDVGVHIGLLTDKGRPRSSSARTTPGRRGL